MILVNAPLSNWPINLFIIQLELQDLQVPGRDNRPGLTSIGRVEH